MVVRARLLGSAEASAKAGRLDKGGKSKCTGAATEKPS